MALVNVDTAWTNSALAFVSLATDSTNSATTDQNVVAELVESVAKLTKANAELVEAVSTLTKANEVLGTQGQQGGRAGRDGGEWKPKKYCKNCKIEVVHPPNDCFELEKNKPKRPRNCVSCLCQCGLTSEVEITHKCNNVLTDNNLPLVSPTSSSRPPLVNVPPNLVSDQTPLKGPAK